MSVFYYLFNRYLCVQLIRVWCGYVKVHVCETPFSFETRSSKFVSPLLSSFHDMADLPTLLRASLDPASRKQAEQNLNALSTQKGFLTHLLALVLQQSQDLPVRLAGGVYLKNIAKLRWEEVRFFSLFCGIHADTRSRA